jgi:hypothetical protein
MESKTAAPAGQGRARDSRDELTSGERGLLEAVVRKDRKATAEFVSTYTDAVYSYLRQRLALET